MHMRVAFNNHHFVYLHTAGFANSSEVVAFEIDEHDMFRSFFGVVNQFIEEALVGRLVIRAWPGSCYGSGRGDAVSDA
jgi:hypothetical protein